MIRGNLRILLTRNEVKKFVNFTVLTNISAIMSLYSPHKLGLSADAWAAVESSEKFKLSFPFTEGGGGGRLSKEEVESGASVTQTPEVYEPNLCKQPGKITRKQKRRLSIWTRP